MYLQSSHGFHPEFIDGYGYHNTSGVAIDHINYDEKTNALILPTMGAWFNEEEKFESLVSIELDYFANLTKRTDVINKVLWLAAWPQHFNTTVGNGYFSLGERSLYQCVPHTVKDND